MKYSNKDFEGYKSIMQKWIDYKYKTAFSPDEMVFLYSIVHDQVFMTEYRNIDVYPHDAIFRTLDEVNEYQEFQVKLHERVEERMKNDWMNAINKFAHIDDIEFGLEEMFATSASDCHAGRIDMSSRDYLERCNVMGYYKKLDR